MPAVTLSLCSTLLFVGVFPFVSAGEIYLLETKFLTEFICEITRNEENEPGLRVNDIPQELFSYYLVCVGRCDDAKVS